MLVCPALCPFCFVTLSLSWSGDAVGTRGGAASLAWAAGIAALLGLLMSEWDLTGAGDLHLIALKLATVLRF